MIEHDSDLKSRVGQGWRRTAALAMCGALLLPGGLAGAQDPPADSPLTGLTLEQLLNVELTLATRRVQKLFDTAAAVYVITAEDLRRSGATSIPEALRMVPGLQVARTGSSRWAISARGFTDEFANKLLVLIDGRTVYTPLFAGVYWDSQDVLLEDVERIEVVRGPGAALWGANAVNGIINIVTWTPGRTSGTLVSAGAGSADRAVIGVRHSGDIGTSGHYRVYTKYFDRAGFEDVQGQSAADQWNAVRGGAQLELLRGDDTWRIDGIHNSGDASFKNSLSAPAPPYVRTQVSSFGTAGGHLLGRFEHDPKDGSQAHLQVYYDHTGRGDTNEVRDTLDVELQHGTPAGGRHRVLWGLGYRSTRDRISSTAVTSFQPSTRTLELYSGFLNDEIAFASGRIKLILGAKLEHNDFTGFELQPNARLAWLPSEHQVAWAAVARAVRTPSRGDRGVRYLAATFPGTDGTLNQVTLMGDSGFVSERLAAYELGYRAKLSPRLSFDAAAFVNDYDRLRTFEPGAPWVDTDATGGVALVLPQVVGNGAAGRTWGLEVAANWVVARGLRIGAGYTGLRVDINPYSSSHDPAAEAAEGDSPRHQLNLHSFADLPAHLELDALFYYASELPNRGVPAWSRLDLMLGFRPSASLELRVGVQDLLGGSQLEFGQNLGGRPATEIPRAVFGKLTWTF